MSEAEELGLEPGGKKAIKASPRKFQEKMYTIIIDEEENRPNFELVGVNGVMFQIMRGVPVEVPERVVNVLKDAVATIYVSAPHPTEPGRQILVPKQRSSIPWRLA